MQKVYLLLRSNQQSGPYTLEELVRFDLKPVDLIWIEGKSAGWYYPQEIQALHPHLSFLSTKTETQTKAVANPTINVASNTTRKVFVTMPYTASAQPVQAQKAPVAPAVAAPTQQPEEFKTTYTKSLDETETDYMNWVYQKKQKQSTGFLKKTVLAVCLLGTIAAAGWYFLKSGNTDQAVVVAVQTPAQTFVQDNGAEVPAVEPAEATPIVGKKQTPSKSITLQKKGEQVAELTAQKEAVAVSAPIINKETAPVIEAPSAAGNDAVPEPVATEAPKEKKKLREKILDLFKKKPEEARPAETEEGNRQSTRREASSNLVQMVTVRFTIPNDWMMGIKGARATLSNRSSETIAAASVEVVYYNDDNEVLAKRTIIFRNIKSKSTAVTAIPDHATATRLEYSVLSATGVGESLASR